MKHPRIIRTAAVPVALCALISACGGGDDPLPVEVKFLPTVGTTRIDCSTSLTALGTTSATARVKDFRFYVSNVVMVAANGDRVPVTLGENDAWNLTVGDDRVTLIDLEDGTGLCSGGTAELNDTLSGTVPSGNYVGMEATIGVPFALNHSDYSSAVAPLDVQAMAWSWQSGRKFAKIEVTDPDGATGSWTAKTFNFHLGSTGCVGNPANGETVACSTPNRMSVTFSSFDPATQQIAVDVAALVAGNDVTVNQAGAAGCMSGGTDPECEAIFERIAIDWKSDGSGTGLKATGGADQVVFKAVAR